MMCVSFSRQGAGVILMFNVNRSDLDSARKFEKPCFARADGPPPHGTGQTGVEPAGPVQGRFVCFSYQGAPSTFAQN
jgi:hypothetical protein